MSHTKGTPRWSRAGALALPFLALPAMGGCAHPRPQATAQPTAIVAPAPTVVAEAKGTTPQEHAQRTWCAYLEALYQRATKDGATWSHLDECRAHSTTASPVMLERTADCSRKALDGFAGDPLSAEYALQVRRCGSEAIDASALSEAEVEPVVTTVCERVQACGGGSFGDCRAAIDGPVSSRLGRAVGALNVESRDRLTACLRAASCDDAMGERVSGCLEPIMDRLLWLPPGHER